MILLCFSKRAKAFPSNWTVTGPVREFVSDGSAGNKGPGRNNT